MTSCLVVNRSCTYNASVKKQTAFSEYQYSTNMEVEQLQLWAKWLELQLHRVRVIMEVAEERQHRRRRRQRQIWVRQWLSRRPLFGQYEQLLQELNREDPKGYKNFLRVDADLFGELVERITPRIEKNTNNR